MSKIDYDELISVAKTGREVKPIESGFYNGNERVPVMRYIMNIVFIIAILGAIITSLLLSMNIKTT